MKRAREAVAVDAAHEHPAGLAPGHDRGAVGGDGDARPAVARAGLVAAVLVERARELREALVGVAQARDVDVPAAAARRAHVDDVGGAVDAHVQGRVDDLRARRALCDLRRLREGLRLVRGDDAVQAAAVEEHDRQAAVLGGRDAGARRRAVQPRVHALGRPELPLVELRHEDVVDPVVLLDVDDATGAVHRQVEPVDLDDARRRTVHDGPREPRRAGGRSGDGGEHHERRAERDDPERARTTL